MLAVALLVGAAVGTGGSEPLELRRSPYLGVACPGAPNSIECDRVGLAVWLERPAGRLTARVAGQRVRMRIPPNFAPTRYLGRRGEYWEGFLQPAGMIDGPLRVRPDRGRYLWFGRHPREARVQLVAHYRDGTTATATARVALHPGWG